MNKNNILNKVILNIFNSILFFLLVTSHIALANTEYFYTKEGQVYLGQQKLRLMGANIAFWNKRWEKVTKEDLQQDIELIKQVGNCARIFVPYGEESKGYFGTLNVRNDLLEKLEYFVNYAKKRGVVVIINFLFTNYSELDNNKKFVLQIINKLKDYNNIIYDIQNEPDVEAQFIPRRRASIARWCNKMVEFVKKNDSAHHLLTIGFSGIDMIVSKEIKVDNIDVVSFHWGGKINPYILKRRTLKLRNFLQECGNSDKAIAIEEIGLSSRDFDEKTRAENFQNFGNIVKDLDIPIFLWWVLRDIPKDPNAIDGDRIWLESHRWGIFNADGSKKEASTEVAIKIGKEASQLNFK